MIQLNSNIDQLYILGTTIETTHMGTKGQENTANYKLQRSQALHQGQRMPMRESTTKCEPIHRTEQKVITDYIKKIIINNG